MTPGGNQLTQPDVLELLTPLQLLDIRGRVRVALSGGLDSMVLLHLAHQIFGPRSDCLTAVHINHGLQPAAAQFETFCRNACARLNIPLDVIPVSVSAPAGSGGVEAAARAARYRAFEELMDENDALLMAHHGDDQLETLLFRFLRGSGVRGLAGIPRQRPLGRGVLVRPLLDFSRARLERFAREAGIEWVEDPTNAQSHYDRNFLRHQIVPLVTQRWPSLRQRLRSTAAACAEADALSVALAREQYARLADGEHRLLLPGFRELSLAEQRNLLQWWLGGSLRRTLTDQELVDLTEAADDGAPEIRAGEFAVRRFQSHIYRVRHGSGAQILPVSLVPDQPVAVGRYRISLRRAQAAGGMQPSLQVIARQGGERFMPRSGGPSRSLKKWLQERAVPPWERSSLPLITGREGVVAVADLWCHPDYRESESGSGWWIDVRRDCD